MSTFAAKVVEAIANTAIIRKYILARRGTEYLIPLYVEPEVKAISEDESGRGNLTAGYIVAVYKPTGRTFRDENGDTQFEFEYQGVRI